MPTNKACTRCGHCCKEEICGMGENAFGRSVKPPCPGLIEEDSGIYSCALVKTEQAFDLNPTIAESLGIGRGCCSGTARDFYIWAMTEAKP